MDQIHVCSAGGQRDGIRFLALSTQGLAAIATSPDGAKFLLKQKKKERRQKLFKR